MPGQILDGIKVVDYGATGTGPLTVQHLAQFGATVVTVASATHMDMLRVIPPFADNIAGVNRSGFYAECNVNKFNICLNLKHPRGAEIARKLAAWADIVEENWVPGVMSRWGLSYEDIKKFNPDVIMISATTHGQSGPYSRHPSMGMMTASYAGVNALCGFPDQGMSGTYGAYPDFIAPRYGMIALLAALDYRRRTGKGQYIDMSQVETTSQLFIPLLLDYTINGRVAGKEGNRSATAAPHGAYRCRGEDRWCTIAVTSDDEWAAFCEVIGCPAWTAEDRFATLLARKRHEDELERLIEAWTIQYTAEQVMMLLQSAGIPAGICQDGRDLWEDPQLNHRKFNVRLDHPEMGKCAYTGIRYRLSRTPGELVRPAPLLGQHTEYVCTEILGLTPAEYAEYRSTGVFQ